MIRKIFLTLFFCLFLPLPAWARRGVGVSTGKIIVEEKLMPGVIYKLLPLNVVNTGDESSDYEAEITYYQDQEEFSPPQAWFKLSPKEFYLKPGETEMVEISLSVPIKAIPGDYFCFLEGHPVVKAEEGVTAVNVAAAAKLYFTIAPANFWQGVYYRLVSLWKNNMPWSLRGAVAAGIIILGIVFRKFFNIQIAVKEKPEKKTKKKEKKKSVQKAKTKNE